MLLAPGFSSYGFKYDNWGANPAGTAGTSVTPGTAGAEGAWTEIAAAASITQDCHWVIIAVHAGATSAQIKDHLLDIGIDPAGGTSYTAFASNIVCGESRSIDVAVGRVFLLPMFVKSGSSVAARIQGNNATPGTVRVAAKFFGQPSAPEAAPVGQFSETIGTIASSAGASFTPGNAADGTWVSLGTTTNTMWWWQLGYGISNTTITGEMTYIDLAYGDGSNKVTIMRQFHTGNTGEGVADHVGANLNFLECYCPVPAGATIYVRGRCNNAPDTGYTAVAIGIGG